MGSERRPSETEGLAHRLGLVERRLDRLQGGRARLSPSRAVSRFEQLLDYGSLGAYKLILGIARMLSQRHRRLTQQLAEVLFDLTAGGTGLDVTPPVLSNVQVSPRVLPAAGGTVVTSGGNVSLTDCAIINNKAAVSAFTLSLGGAIYVSAA